MRTSILIAAIALGGVANAQFSSGFESWTGNVPNSWEGVKTNIPVDSVQQVSVNPHGGTYAVRLINHSGTHKRFTTVAQTVTNGQSYDVSFWARGNGNIRVGLYDGRSTGFGYAPYSPYTTVNGAWTHITKSIIAAKDTTVAEFIISVQSTSGADNIVVDDVNITTGSAPVNASIHDIQFTLDTTSALLGMTVSTGGIITASDTDGYYIQQGHGPWSGVYVFDARFPVPLRGDSVTLVGTVHEFDGNTELDGIALFTTVSSSNPVPGPDAITTAMVSLEQWEGVLVRVTNANCTSLVVSGNWIVDDATGPAYVGKRYYSFSPALGTHYQVTGPIEQHFSKHIILPRDANDIEVYTGMADEGVLASAALYPNPASDALTIDLGHAASARIIYTLSDASGRMVMNGTLINERSIIAMNTLSSGMYSLVLRSDAMVKSIAVQVVR